MQNKILKSGINSPIICKGCGRRIGYIKMKSTVKWRTIKWMLGLGIAFEIIANIIVYLIFQ